MIIIGCDFHNRFQQIAMVDPDTGNLIERRLEHENGDAEKFYGALAGPARVGMEATINALWFERMLHHSQHELWIGDAAAIRAWLSQSRMSSKMPAAPLCVRLRREKQLPHKTPKAARRIAVV